jgi:hypothetical protein
MTKGEVVTQRVRAYHDRKEGSKQSEEHYGTSWIIHYGIQRYRE